MERTLDSTGAVKGSIRDYDPFAWLYAHYWGTDYHRQIPGLLDKVLLKLLPAEAPILDLCCGDGRLAGVLARRGFRVTGIDGSPAMLRFARVNAPEARFKLGDARNLNGAGPFKAVISTFDSLNHVLERQELRAVFHGVYKSLEPGGYFLFDLIREQAYLELWEDLTSMVLPEVATINQSSYDRKRGIATCLITQFRLTRGSWRRSDFILTQRHHPHKAVLAGLEKARFSAIASLDAAGDLGMKEKIGLYRTFYLARK
jgi:SAM-dependent methyltransferase